MAIQLNLEKFRKMLLAEKARLERERRITAEDEADLGDELSNYDNHPADSASDTFERTKDHAIDENYRELIDSIEDALRKIDDGTYGLCDRCKQSISADRLKAIPYATLCIQCQEIIERR